jgi:hypothetical protein
LHIVVQESNLFARLESRHTDIRTTITTESVPKTAIATGSNFPLYRKVDFGKIICSEFKGL